MAAGGVDRSQSLDELRQRRQLLLLDEFKLLKFQLGLSFMTSTLGWKGGRGKERCMNLGLFTPNLGVISKVTSGETCLDEVDEMLE